MDLLIQTAHAQAPGGQESPLAFFLPLLIFVAVFYFLLIRPQQKRAKQHRTMVAALATGDEVVTNGGLLGRVTAVGDHFLTLEIAPGTEVKVRKDMVGTVMPKGTVKGA